MNSSFDYNPFTPRECDNNDQFDLDLFHFWPNYTHRATFMAIHDGFGNESTQDSFDKPSDDNNLAAINRYSLLMDLN